jgi:hypothetical protein
MSAPIEPDGSPAEEAELGNGALVDLAWAGDALPVLAGEARVLAPRAGAAAAASEPPNVLIPIAQAAAAAAGGFVAGAALVGLARRRQRQLASARPRRAARSLRRAPSGGRSTRPAELVQIVGSRSLLVDVHLLGQR